MDKTAYTLFGYVELFAVELGDRVATEILYQDSESDGITGTEERLRDLLR